MDQRFSGERFVEEITESRYHFYKKTESGDLLHRLLKNGEIIEALLRVSGKRLRLAYHQVNHFGLLGNVNSSYDQVDWPY